MTDEPVLFTSNLPNDQDLIAALGSAAFPVPLEFADVAFWGNSGGEEALRVCIERKRLNDMASCIRDGRYLFQAQRAKEAGFDVLILVLEGRVKPSPFDGQVLTPGWDHELGRKGWIPLIPTVQYSRWCQFLFELSYFAGIHVVRSEDVRETAIIIKALWVNFQQSPDKHNSLHQMFKPPAAGAIPLVRSSLLKRMAFELDGIGWERADAVAKHFKSVAEMVHADAKEWMKVDGVGKLTAQKAVVALNNL